MKIGIFFPSLNPTGASTVRFQAAILEGLMRKNVDRHSFVVLSWSGSNGLEASSSLKYVTVRKNGRYWKTWAFLKKCLARIGLRIVRLLGFREGKILNALLNWRLGEPGYYKQLKELGIRLIWQATPVDLPTWLPSIRSAWDVNYRIHPEYPEYSYNSSSLRMHEELERHWGALRKAAYVITGTEEGKRQVISLYGVYERRVRVIPFPTPLLPDSADAPVRDIGLKGPYLLYPARFWPHKNHVVAVAALKILRDQWNLNLNFVFSGADEGNLDYVLSYAQTLGVREQINYVGEVSLAELAALYKNALALAYVSATGPDNLPPLEAMSAGCPAIVADVPGAREQYGDACLFFPPMDERALAAQIKLLLDDPAVREALILKGRDRAKKWTVEDYASEMIALFDEFELTARSWGSSTAVF